MKGKPSKNIKSKLTKSKSKQSKKIHTPTVGFFQAFWKFKGIRLFTYFVTFLLFLAMVLLFTFTILISRPHLNNPTLAHYHLRLQVFENEKKVDFSKPNYQQEYSKDNCNAKLPNEPLHFHDGNGQLLHVHWQGITGGEVLKYYGYNAIGGLPNTLGFRFDSFPQTTTIPTKGINDTSVSSSTGNIHVYIGRQDGYYKASSIDFLFKDLEIFLKKSKKRIQDEQSKTSSFISIPIAAQDTTLNAPLNETELNEINELIGNVVVYIQTNEPKPDDIQEAFNNLTPLTASICGG